MVKAILYGVVLMALVEADSVPSIQGDTSPDIARRANSTSHEDKGIQHKVCEMLLLGKTFEKEGEIEKAYDTYKAALESNDSLCAKEAYTRISNLSSFGAKWSSNMRTIPWRLAETLFSLPVLIPLGIVVLFLLR